MAFKNPLAQSIDLIKTPYPPLSNGFVPLRKKEECEEMKIRGECQQDNNKNANRRTPFKLAFGTEVVILAEVGISNLRQAHYDKGTNNDVLKLNLDCLAEIRDEAALRIARYQQKMEKYHNQRVKLRRFNPDDMVLQRVPQATRDPTQGK